MSKDYEVGYGKPPKATQFKAGQSGNPKGRKKGSKNISTRVRAAIEEVIEVTVKGERKKLTKFDAALIQQANKAVSGDLKAMTTLLGLQTAAEARERSEAASDVTPDERRRRQQRFLDALKAQYGEEENEDGL